MRLGTLILAGVLWTTSAAAQGPVASSAGVTTPGPQKSAPSSPGAGAKGATAPEPQTTADPESTSSLSRIREGLKKAPAQSLLQGLDRKATFTVEIREKAKIEDMLKRLDFRTGPTPAGGLYAYEQQQRLFSPTAHPLTQPYAAYNAGEFFTIALQNILGRYLGKALISKVGDVRDAAADRAAKDEVDRNIAEYCASRPDRWDITLCQGR